MNFPLVRRDSFRRDGLRDGSDAWLQPDDISPAAVFLASDAANMMTGAEYEVTGGDSAKDI
jgi:NAD(P)-dependent dehydrogenase (short-subunit alcohol dehydrogenase family)